MIKEKQGNYAGFTLIELLVVISIIGILTALLLANFVGIRERGRDAKIKNDMNALKTALRLQYNDTQTYPAGSNVVCSGVIGASYLGDTELPANCRYTQTNSGDGFYAYVTLNSDAGSDDEDSASRCGISSPVAGAYYVCTN